MIAASELKALADDLEVIEHSLRIFYRNYISQPVRDRRVKREEKKRPLSLRSTANDQKASR
jgi:hypothetical protein